MPVRGPTTKDIFEMAVPKKKVTSSKRNMRRAHDA
ncbi:MAG: 50S ribosomal protein L32, partial [Arenibacter algicola]|nr:50S ribosomal protein L32 [Arenibacter algicola]